MGRLTVILLIGFQCILLTNSLGLNGELGCYKANHITRCFTEMRDSQEIFQKNITKSIAHAIQWMREQTHNYPLLSSDILQTFLLSGYINDGGLCTKNLNTEKYKILDEIRNNSDIPGGRLAKYLIGLRASCHDNKENKKLLNALIQKMKKFPQAEFNNFFQLSLAMIALHVHDREIPIEYGEKLFQTVFKSKTSVNQIIKAHTTDTESLGVIALSALLKQKSTPFSLKQKIKILLKDVENKIHQIFTNNNEDNLITLSLLLQALTRTEKSFFNGTYCRSIYEKLLNNQSADGSVGTLQETSVIIKALSGYSILDIKKIKCPLNTESLDLPSFQRFLEQHRNMSKGQSNATVDNSNKKPIDVTLIVSNNVDETTPPQILEQKKLTIPFGSTALNALQHGSKVHKCFRHETKTSSWGEYITRICDLEQDHEKRAYWMFHVNGKLANKGAGKSIVKHGDVIEFRYTLYKPHSL